MELKLMDISKTYGEVKALDHLNIAFSNGIYGILGPNGAGKSTMINLITDNVTRETGEILCDGTDIIKLGGAFRKKLGYMPQQQGMYHNYSAMAFLKYMAALKGIPGKQAKEEIEGLLHVVNLWDFRHKKIGGFSGGMKQRVLLAQALLGDPQLLILDEPTAGLDPNERINIRNYISELGKDRIILFATHVVSDIECIADKILLLQKGHALKFSDTSDMIQSLEGKVGEIYCSEEEMKQYQSNYKIGNINRVRDGYLVRLIGEDLPQGVELLKDSINLEDVYLYYLASNPPH